MAGDLAVAADRAGAMMTEQVAAGNWLVVAPVVVAIAGGAILLMLRHHLRWQAAVHHRCSLR